MTTDEILEKLSEHRIDGNRLVPIEVKVANREFYPMFESVDGLQVGKEVNLQRLRNIRIFRNFRSYGQPVDGLTVLHDNEQPEGQGWYRLIDEDCSAQERLQELVRRCGIYGKLVPAKVFSSIENGLHVITEIEGNLIAWENDPEIFEEGVMLFDGFHTMECRLLDLVLVYDPSVHSSRGWYKVV